MKTLLIKLMKYSHLIVLVYTLIGWLLPVSTLGFYMFWVMTLIVQWELNSGTCVLTNLENHLEGESMGKQKEEQQGQFLKGLIQKIFGFQPTDKNLKSVIYILMYLFFVVALFRYSS